MSTPLTSHPRLAAFVLSEASGQRSRENIKIAMGSEPIPSGSILSKTPADISGVYARDSGATGNFTSSTVDLWKLPPAGVYTGTFTAPTAYTVRNAANEVVGTGVTGTEFDHGDLIFTIVAGSTAAVAGDKFTVTVTSTDVLYSLWVEGGDEAQAILYSHIPAGSGTVEAVAFVRDCEVNRHALVGFEGNAGEALATVGIIVRGNPDALGVHTPAL